MEYIFIIIAGYFAFMSSHIVSEQKAGKHIPLPWEKESNQIFDKSKIKYTDGDNT